VKIIILSGFPGSGKSYFCEQQDPIGLATVSADHYLDPKTLDFGQAHRLCCKDYITLIQRDDLTKIIVDNTNLNAWEIAPYYLAGEAHGHHVEVRRIHCDPALAFKRQQHNVPFDAFCIMVANFKKRDVLPWWNVYENK
jgi:hypothetical protein